MSGMKAIAPSKIKVKRLASIASDLFGSDLKGIFS